MKEIMETGRELPLNISRDRSSVFCVSGLTPYEDGIWGHHVAFNADHTAGT